MEETYPTKCLILDRRDFRERDSRVFVYSPDRGYLELIARGTKRPKSKLAAHIEPFTLSNIMVIKGKRFDYLGSAVSTNCFPLIKESFEKLEAGGKAFRYFIKLVEPGISDQVLFEITLEYLTFLSENNITEPKFWATVYLLKIMSHLGYRPELYNCVDDGGKIQPGGNCFNTKKGGLVCGSCPKDEFHLTISNNAIKILRIIITGSFNDIKRIKTSTKIKNEITKIISSFYKYQF